ncbi:Phospholipase B [Bryocella elongata]|uniref:Phospholipase B n=1 Tax=Bryocella elongata TaxID=863522 RepID=A0A1H6AAP4_9BACT|nr:C45 family peptidase [Bryocella elongata]SEG45370.1 Phospholipase B [Bryocella elongata]
MRLLIALALGILCLSPVTSQAEDARLKGGYTFRHDGWTYVHLEGTPGQIGFQHGYLLTPQIEDNVKVYQVEAPHAYERDWAFFREAGRTQLWENLDPEYKEELKGIAAGLKAHGSSLDLWDVVALNGVLEIGDYYIPTLNKKENRPNPPAASAPGKCSAFIATGSATKDGKIVIAHSNWSSYAEGERWTMMFDIQPQHGYRILMDGLPGVITSQDDFGVNASGIMMTETTLPMAAGFDKNGVAEFDRSRKALQYASSIDDYAAIMRKGNNGGYANSWLVGDRKTGEIAYLELGLRHTPLTRRKDGYFVSSNFAADPDLIRDDTPGFNPNDLSSSMNARRVTGEQFMKTHYGKLDAQLAEAFLSDHYDSYEKKIDIGKRSLCGHEELSAEGEKVWGNPPYSPSGAVTGEVMDDTMAANMSMIVRAGHPCGDNFLAEPFFKAHPEFAWQKPILHDMKAGPWSQFSINAKVPSANAD